MRDISKERAKAAAILVKHNRADLTVNELDQFYKMLQKDEWNGITALFEMGISVGYRLGKADAKADARTEAKAS